MPCSRCPARARAWTHSGRACPPASPARPRSRPCPPPPRNKHRRTRLAGAGSSRPRLRVCEKTVASEGRSRSAGAQEPECMLKSMRIPSTAGTRYPKRSRFFHKLSADARLSKDSSHWSGRLRGRAGATSSWSKKEGWPLCRFPIIGKSQRVRYEASFARRA